MRPSRCGLPTSFRVVAQFFQIDISDFHATYTVWRCEKNLTFRKNMCGLRTSFCLAKKMDKGLGVKYCSSDVATANNFSEMIMARPLPFTAITDTGDKFDVDFPLHEATEAQCACINYWKIFSPLSVGKHDVTECKWRRATSLCAMALAIKSCLVADPK